MDLSSRFKQKRERELAVVGLQKELDVVLGKFERVYDECERIGVEDGVDWKELMPRMDL